MSNHTSPTSENNPRAPTIRGLAKLLNAVGNRLFAANDEEAAQHGWQITSRQGGLARSYRDPRFDLLATCHRCGGSGQATRELCSACDGRGRVRRTESWNGARP